MKKGRLYKYVFQLLFSFSLIIVSLSAFPQDCVFKLQEAQRLYNRGQVEKIPEILTPCLSKGFTREDKLQAFKLLIQVYQLDDNTQKAEETLLDFLNIYPEYKPTPADPAEFVQLLNNFEVIPRFSAGALAGSGFTFVQVTGKYDSQGTYQDHGSYSSTGIPLNMGLFVNFFLMENLQLSLEFDFSSFKFTYENNQYLGFGQLSYKETQNNLTLPLSVSYDFPNKSKWMPYLRGGMGVSMLVQVRSRTSLRYNSLVHDPRTGEDLDRISNRNRFNGFGLLGGGIKYKLSKGYLLADLRFNFGFFNQTNPSNRYVAGKGTYADNDQNWYYLYTDDDFRIHKLSFSLGYVRKFYSARKR